MDWVLLSESDRLVECDTVGETVHDKYRDLDHVRDTVGDDVAEAVLVSFVL